MAHLYHRRWIEEGIPPGDVQISRDRHHGDEQPDVVGAVPPLLDGHPPMDSRR